MSGDFYHVVTWAIIVLGWFIINQQQNSRELRKEIRSAIDILTEQIYELEEESINYHAEGSSAKSSQSIKQSIDRIEFQLEVHRLIPLSIRNKKIIALRRAITRNNFDTYKYKKVAISDPIILDINYAITDIIQSIEYQYRVKYPA